MRRKRLAALFMGVLLILTACGAETDETGTTEAGTTETNEMETSLDTSELGTESETADPTEVRAFAEYAELVRKIWVRKGCPQTETGTLAFVVYEDIEGDRYIWNNVWNYGGADMATHVEQGELGYCYWDIYTKCINTTAENSMMKIGMVEMELDKLGREIDNDFPEKNTVLYEHWRNILKELYKGETLVEKKQVTFYVFDFDCHSYRSFGIRGMYNKQHTYDAVSEVVKDQNGQDVYHVTGKWNTNIYSERIEDVYREMTRWIIEAEIEIVTPEDEHFEQYRTEEEKSKKLISTLTQCMGEIYYHEKNEIFGTMKGQIYIMNHLEEEHYKLAQAWICLDGSEPKRMDIIASARGEVKEIKELEEIFSSEIIEEAAIIVNCQIVTEEIRNSEE